MAVEEEMVVAGDAVEVAAEGDKDRHHKYNKQTFGESKGSFPQQMLIFMYEFNSLQVLR